MESTNKDLVQSFKMTTIRNGLGIYGQRVLVCIAEASQQFLQGKEIGKCETYKIEPNLWGDVQIQFPIKKILPPGDDSNYTAAIKQLRKLLKTTMEYEAQKGVWVGVNFVSKIKLNKLKGEATIKIDADIWGVIMDFSKGFRRYELNKALELRLPSSMRLYILMSGQEKPLSYMLEDLKKMFGVENKYPRPVDFVKRVIVPAKEELDATAPYSFDFKPILERKTGRGKPGIVGITFLPLYQPKNRDKDLAEKAEYSNIQYKYPNVVALPKGTKNYLIQAYGFTETGIKNNEELFNTAIKYMNLDNFLREPDFINRARNAKKTQGYVIRAIKCELKEKGIKA